SSAAQNRAVWKWMIAPRYHTQYVKDSSIPTREPFLTVALFLAIIVLAIGNFIGDYTNDPRLPSLFAFNAQHPLQVWRYFTYEWSSFVPIKSDEDRPIGNATIGNAT